MERVRKEKSKDMKMKVNRIKKLEEKRGITLIALVITIVLNSSYLAMGQMNKFEKI